MTSSLIYDDELQTADTLFDEAREYRAKMSAGELGSIRTGISKLDHDFGGIGGLFVLGGRPGTGKTSLALQVAVDGAERGDFVSIFQSAEMPRVQLANRILRRFELEWADDDEVEQRYRRMGRRLLFQDGEKITPLEQMPELISELRGRNDISSALVVVDSVHMRAAADGQRPARFKDAIDEYLGRLRELVQDPCTHVLALAHQCKTDSEGFYFAESARFDYLADRTAVLLGRGKSARTLRIHKNRDGKTGDVDLHFNGPTFTFTEKGRRK